jgi:hypothetical protein
MAELMPLREGAMRKADAVLRATGGSTVMLRMPAPAAAGNDAEQLGLATPEFQDLPLGPAAFRKADSVKTLLISASAVDEAVGTLAFDSVDVLFETSAGVLIDGLLYEITDCVASRALGGAYCYCLTLEPPVR